MSKYFVLKYSLNCIEIEINYYSLKRLYNQETLANKFLADKYGYNDGVKFLSYLTRSRSAYFLISHNIISLFITYG